MNYGGISATTGQAKHRDLHAVRGAIGDAPAVTLFGEEHDSPVQLVRQSSASDVADAAITVISQHWQVSDETGTRPARWSDVAILIPTRSTLRSLEWFLQAKGVPYRLEVSSLLWSTDEARDLLTI
jgi:ATP-dependent exoDNAse (exonuclease V) beta subunit